MRNRLALAVAIACLVLTLPAAARDSSEQREQLAKAGEALARHDSKAAKRILGKLAKDGNVEAARRLGLLIWNAHGNARTRSRACDLFEQASSAGDARGTALLGECFATGLGRDQDEARAEELFQQAVSRGDGWASCGLGMMYVNRKGADDRKKGVELCRKSAEAGEAYCQALIGKLYLDGSGLAKDEKLALTWLERADSGKSATAALLLGSLYQNGRAVPKDDARAASHYQDAYDRGDASAAAFLATIYLDEARSGSRREQLDDLVKAVFMARIAAKEDPDPKIRKRMQALARQITTRSPQVRERLVQMLDEAEEAASAE